MKKVLMFSALFSIITAVSFFLFIGCGNENPIKPASQSMGIFSSPTAVASEQPEGLVKLSHLRNVMDIQDKHTKKLMEKEGIVGTATGLGENGEPVILVFAKAEKDKNDVPASLDNIPVVVEVTGEFHALDRVAIPRAAKAPGGTRVSHTAKQNPPIKLGTSGGWTHDLANGFCCGGTLGALVTNGATQYILSNYHVFQADIVPGDNSRTANAGDPIIQPGLIDVSCNAAGAQTVATLSSFAASLPNSNVDASIAAVVPGMVSATGEILEIGTLSGTTVAAALNQKVKKSGRTTRLTRSYINGLNATISVAYDNECAGGAAFTKKYTNQIVIKNLASKFLNSGDSGSLLVEDKATDPGAIGLLFAGSNTAAIANPR